MKLFLNPESIIRGVIGLVLVISGEDMKFPRKVVLLVTFCLGFILGACVPIEPVPTLSTETPIASPAAKTRLEFVFFYSPL